MSAILGNGTITFGDATVQSTAFISLHGNGGVNNNTYGTLFTMPVNTSWVVAVQTGNANGQAMTYITIYAHGGNIANATQIQNTHGGWNVQIDAGGGGVVYMYNSLGGPIDYGWRATRIY